MPCLEPWPASSPAFKYVVDQKLAKHILTRPVLNTAYFQEWEAQMIEILLLAFLCVDAASMQELQRQSWKQFSWTYANEMLIFLFFRV